MPLVPIGVALAVIDWHTTLLPTRIIAPSYGVVVVGVVLAGLVDGDRDSVVRAGLGWAVMGGFFVILWLVYPRGLGYGDVRLSGVLGLALGYVGWPELVTGMYGAFLIGGIGGALLGALKMVNRKRFPFGPFMLVAAVLGVACGSAVTSALGY
jgi:leader peptidase (prepilin peptidase)/N-methyltransferase